MVIGIGAGPWRAMTVGMAGILCLLAGFAAEAQTADETALRAKQAEQFERLFNAPDDLELMYAYALTSIELRDYEAAISTLERILIYRPDTPSVELELGAAYYRVGAYAIAEFYFEEAKSDPKSEPALVERAEAFLAEISARTKGSTLVGSVSANLIATTNANNGPPSRFIDFGGLTARLDGDDVTAQSDFGASLTAQLTHSYDLGGLNEDSWRTNITVFSERYDDTPSGAVDVFILRSGPRLSLTDDSRGAKLRPFAEFDHVRSSNSARYTTLGAGVELTDTLDANTGFFSEVRMGWRDFHNVGLQSESGLQARGAAGLVYFYGDALTLRGQAQVDYEGAETRSLRSVEFGAGFSATYRYDSGFAFAGRPWSVRASAKLLRREHFADDPVAQVRRRDTDIRLSLGHTAHLADGWAFTIRGEYFKRFSNSRNFRLNSFSLNVGATHFF